MNIPLCKENGSPTPTVLLHSKELIRGLSRHITLCTVWTCPSMLYPHTYSGSYCQTGIWQYSTNTNIVLYRAWWESNFNSKSLGPGSSKPDEPNPGLRGNFPASLFVTMRRILHQNEDQNAWITTLKTKQMVLVFLRLNSCWLLDQKSKSRISLILD